MAVAGGEHLVAELPQRVPDKVANVLVVLDQKDRLSRLLRRLRLDLDRGIGEPRCFEPWQVDPNVPIVVMSGGGAARGTDYLSVARELGATKTLKKPLKPQELIDVVHQITRSPLS